MFTTVKQDTELIQHISTFQYTTFPNETKYSKIKSSGIDFVESYFYKTGCEINGPM